MSNKEFVANYAVGSHIEQMLQELCLSGYGPHTLLDIGANVGLFTRAFRTYFPNCKPTLVEPNPNCVEILAGSGFEVSPVAVSNENGQATLFMTKLEPQSTGASLYRERTDYFSDENVIRTDVPRVRIDDYFAGRKFDFVKMDIQGAELDALRGGEQIIRQADYVLIELSLIEYNEGEPPVEHVAAMMRQMGFHIVDIVEYHRHQKVYDGNLIQIDALFERRRPRPTQSHHYGPLDNHGLLLNFLKKQREMSPDYSVIDIGAAANPWSAEVIDATFDMNPCPVAKTHFTGNLNDRRAWEPVLAHVAKHGKFSYSICSHTLEDLANPSLALELLPQIAERGYLAVPSRFREFLRHEGPYRGYIHHRWIFDAQAGDITLYPKLGFIEHMAVERENEQMNNPNYYELRVLWRKNINWSIINNDYMGPSVQAVIGMYSKLYSRPL